jgi:alkylation response protein AidB-like acyl-CoA dehydrogenase
VWHGAVVNLELSEQQAFFLETTRRFLQAEAPTSLVRSLHATEDGFERAWWQRGAEIGWASLLASEEQGGGSLSGRPVADAAIVAEELGRMVSPGPFLGTNLVIAGLAAGGTVEQQSTWLPGLIAGELVGTWAVGEPGSRWDPAQIELRVDVDGPEVVLHGTKAYVESAAVADVILVTGRTGAGLTQVLVPAGTSGVDVRPCRSVDLVRRYGEVRFDNVRLPATAVVGELSGAGAEVDRLLGTALVLQCAETVGAMDSAFESTLAYMNERYAFGRPIASFQALKHRVADMLLQLESSKATTEAAAAALDDDATDTARLASVAKAYVGAAGATFIQECIQFLGGIGVTWEHDIHLYLRRVTLNRAMYGTPEHHRERVCALLDI